MWLTGIDGKTAIVTGGSRGIGRAVAEALHAAGASVVINGRDERRPAAAASEIGDRVAWSAGSVRHEGVAEATMERAIETFGSADILINNAATNPYFGPLMGISRQQMATTAEANLSGVVAWTQACWNAWMGDHGGATVNLASVGGHVTEDGIGYCNATKAAVIHLTRQLGAEMAPTVRVNAVAPGIVRTDMAKVLWEHHEAELNERIPLGRIGETVDIANAVAFLASDRASWITGTTVMIDGGATVAM